MRGNFQPPTERNTYAVTLSIRCCKVALAILAYFGLELHQFDVSNAFLHVKLDEEDMANRTYPDGFKVPDKLLRVQRVLYRLPASSRLWYNHFVSSLSEF